VGGRRGRADLGRSITVGQDAVDALPVQPHQCTDRLGPRSVSRHKLPGGQREAWRRVITDVGHTSDCDLRPAGAMSFSSSHAIGFWSMT